MSSKRALRRKSCRHKVRHLTAECAQATIRALHAQRGCQGRMNAYLCRFCNGYHIGHTPRQGESHGPR